MSTRLPRANSNPAVSVIDILDAKAVSKTKAKVRRYDYWIETHRPLVCLLFMLPLLLWYEISMDLYPEAIRSGIDRLLQTLLWPLGDAGLAVLPLATLGAMLYLHHRQGDKVRVEPKTIASMFVESVALGGILFLTCDALMLYLSDQQPRPLAGLATVFTDPTQYGRVLTCVGAGIHEELLFRLLMFAPLMLWIRKKSQSEKLALIVAAVTVSLLFAIAHCDVLNPEGTPFRPSTFLFRFLASVFLCFLFRFRGIGIAIGVHVVFNILAIS